MAPPSNGYPTFTASIPRPRVRWLTTVFDPARSGDVTVGVHRDEVRFSTVDYEGFPLVLVTLHRSSLGSLRTRVAGSFDIAADKFAELAKMVRPGRQGALYRFRMDGDGVLFAGSGSLVRSFGVGGRVRRPPADFVVTAENLNPSGLTGSLEAEW